MMLAPSMIRDLLANLQLAIRDPKHFDYVFKGLSLTLNENRHLDVFDYFAFAWGLLPQWARVSLLAMAYRKHKPVLTGITPQTPIEQFTPEQREILAQSCEEFLAAIVTLFADMDFTREFHHGWAPARRQQLQAKILQSNFQEKKAA